MNERRTPIHEGVFLVQKDLFCRTTSPTNAFKYIHNNIELAERRARGLPLVSSATINYYRARTSQPMSYASVEHEQTETVLNNQILGRLFSHS